MRRDKAGRARPYAQDANLSDTDFPIQNLPFCAFWQSSDEEEPSKLALAIGDKLFDISSAMEAGLFGDDLRDLSAEIEISDLTFMSEVLGTELCRFVRKEALKMLSGSASSEVRSKVTAFLVNKDDVELELPFSTNDYTDFYCSIYHATNVGSMFRPDNPLLPNYKYLPIGYHGRASSIVISGTDITRPKGQNRSDAEKPPAFIPCKNLDYEMELGFFVGKGNELGHPIDIKDAEEHIFGVCLVNDWSARDIQAWEYQPLGPFLSKSFATTISPFVVTMEALAPFRTPAFERGPDDPQPLGYLYDEQNQTFGGLDINLEVYIQTEKMRQENIRPFMLSRSNTKDLYWTIGQMLTHHASNGCNLQTGDLMASGTVSGKEKNERGCLLELTWRGSEPIELPSGETRRFLEDGDEVIMKGYCEREGFRRIGLGECRGRVLPAD
ncbi:fumarylacetoacetase [Leptolyngbya sp. 7M]|uniref:fumarylacetoacetase n=1 Tax=Leptolyngbya sp. 7M TaxID=2812896 RepID=UPI001B8D73A6|nr:fumarylacetoacetase [Leptolyngbya sp. 7M]QYO65875.1 fumarylacetoacetase [Leptolyngbya sp. 7M]